MCGILGAVTRKKQDNFFEKFKSSLKKLDTRGPDSSGMVVDGNVFLGHTRLAIVDTSVFANQPFLMGDYSIIFNGEIYNFHELKKELIALGNKFMTTSDTEVLLMSYKQWGEACVQHIDGMWSFCIHDKVANKLFLSRDKIGEKPMLYCQGNNIFVFGSEIHAIIEHLKPKEIKPNYLALSNFDLYNFRHIPSPLTAFENIFKLEPGYNLIFDLESFSFKKYKYFQVKKVDIEADPVAQFDIILQRSVAQTCYADVPVGIFLSGGIDSSLIASVMKNRNIVAYSLGYDEEDPEIVRAEAIAKRLGLKNKKIFFKEYLEKVDIIEVIERVIIQYGEPINLMQIIYADIILKEMKKDGIKVAVGGNGADELFYGYNGMNLLSRISDVKKFLDIIQIGKILPNHKFKEILYRYSFIKNPCIRSEYKQFLYGPYLEEYASEIPSGDLIDVFSWIGLRIENEHSITIVNDIAGSINGMEVRTPFLNRDVINFSCSLPSTEKIVSYTDPTYNKRILKKTLEKYLPNELIYYKKMGFGYGIDSTKIILANPKAEYYLLVVSKYLKHYDHLEIAKLYEAYKSGKKINVGLLIGVILTGIWYDKFIIGR